MKKFSLLILLLFMVLLSACTKKSNEKITVVLDWTPNTNHTGLYVALDKGYYSDLGLDVEIIQPGESYAESLVGIGNADFGVSYQESVTFARLADTPIKSIGAIIQHNTSGFIARKDSGITTPADFEGKTYGGGWSIDIEKATIKQLMENYDADFSTVDVSSANVDFFAASNTEIDFVWAFEGWTGIEAQIKGIEYNYVELKTEDEIFDYYTPVIITNDKMIDENNEIVKDFMEATKKGYEFAIDNHSESADILLKYAPELDSELVKKSQEFLADKYQADASSWGIQDKAVWDRYTNWLYENEFIDELISSDQLYTNDFN